MPEHAPRWGGGGFCPPAGFFDSSKTAADIDAKISVPSPALIWRLSPNSSKICREIFEKIVLVTSCFVILGRKSANVWRLPECFKVRRNRITPNGKKSNALQNGYLGLLIFFEFGPQTQNFDFSKIIAYKIQHFQDIKNGIHAINIHTHNIHAQFQSNIFIFGYAMANNQARVMSLFEAQFLAFLIVVHKNEWHVWNPWDKTGHDRHVL